MYTPDMQKVQARAGHTSSAAIVIRTDASQNESEEMKYEKIKDMHGRLIRSFKAGGGWIHDYDYRKSDREFTENAGKIVLCLDDPTIWLVAFTDGGEICRWNIKYVERIDFFDEHDGEIKTGLKYTRVVDGCEQPTECPNQACVSCYDSLMGEGE